MHLCIKKKKKIHMCMFSRKQPLAPPTSIRVDWIQLIKKKKKSWFYWGNWEYRNLLMKEVEEERVTTSGLTSSLSG